MKKKMPKIELLYLIESLEKLKTNLMNPETVGEYLVYMKDLRLTLLELMTRVEMLQDEVVKIIEAMEEE